MMPDNGRTVNQKRNPNWWRQLNLYRGLNATGLLIVLLGTLARGEPEADPLSTGVSQFRSGYNQWDLNLLTNSVNSFQKACTINSTSPEPYYWLCVARFHILLHQTNQSDVNFKESEFKKLAGELEKDLKVSIQIDGKNSETHAMLATLIGMRIAGGLQSPFWAGFSLQKHKRLATDHDEYNPRVKYLLGVNTIKGQKGPDGLKKGLKLLLQAETLFKHEQEEPRSRMQPAWGYDHCLVFIGRAYQELNQIDDAEKYYKKALMINPSCKLAERELEALLK